MLIWAPQGQAVLHLWVYPGDPSSASHVGVHAVEWQRLWPRRQQEWNSYERSSGGSCCYGATCPQQPGRGLSQGC